MKKDSGKTGILLRFDTLKNLAEIPAEYLRNILLTICAYADPESSAFDLEPDWDQIFPDMDGNTKQFLLSTWGFLSREIQKDDESFIYKNSKRQYNSFCTNAARWGKLDRIRDIITYEEWVQIGSLGWRQWDRLGRPVPAPEPLNTSVPTVPARPIRRADDTQSYRFEITPDTPAAVTADHAAVASAFAPGTLPTPDSVSDSAPWTNSDDSAAETLPAPDAAEYSAAGTFPVPDSAAYSAQETSGAPELPAMLRTCYPILQNAFLKWVRYWEQMSGKKLPQMSRDSLAERFIEYGEEFTPSGILENI